MRIPLETKELPDKWYNIVPDLPFSLPPPMSPSGFPLMRSDLESLAPNSIISQELEKSKREVEIPEEVRKLYSDWRPTPLYRAERFEKLLETPARIFYKYEGSSFSGGHELNTAIAQAYYAAQDGAKYVTTASGNGEWGASLTMACNYFNIKCRVYMVRSGYEERIYGHYLMKILGAEVIPSPHESTYTGKNILSETPDSPGSLSIALSEAFEDASSHDDTKFCWGTIMNHVLLHQSIIGLEAMKQLRQADSNPDIIIGAVGGGSGFGGLIFPFYRDRKKDLRMIAAETASTPSLSKGRYSYDYADAGKMPLLLRMYTLGHGFVPPGIRAGGMRYHGMSPLISALYREKQIEARVCTQRQALEAAVSFARAEGCIPSPESSYALKVVVDEAMNCKKEKERKNILFILTGNNNTDIITFKDFIENAIEDQPFLEERVHHALQELPAVSSD